VGGVHEDIKSLIKGSCLYGSSESTTAEAMQWLQILLSPTWLVNLKTLKNTDYSGYTERFRNLQARHLDDILSFDRLGHMDAEISGPTNYTALNLLSDMRKGYGKRLIPQQPCLFIVEIYNGLYCKMEYLMKEEIKSTRSADYYNVAQSDVRALVRGVNNLKNGVGNSKSRAADTEIKYHYADCIERIALILDPK
jgi:hypothetical protein